MGSDNEGSGGKAYATPRWTDEAGPQPARAIRVALLDPDASARATLRRVLLSAGFAVVDEAASREEALMSFASSDPDVIIIDKASLLAPANAIAAIMRGSPRAGLVVQSTCGECRAIVEAIYAGATRQMPEQSGADELVEAVRNVAEHRAAAGPETAVARIPYLRDSLSRSFNEHKVHEISASLTERELEIFQRLPRGESNAEMAQALCLAENTVKNYVASILAKLGLENRVQAAVEAVRSGLGCLGGAAVGSVLVERGEVLSEALEMLLPG